MRKIIAVAIAGLLLFSNVSLASVGSRKDGTSEGSVVDIDWRGSHTSKSGTVLTVYSNGYKDGVTTYTSAESNLGTTALGFGIVKLEGGTAKSISIANGTAGQTMTFIMTSYDGGDITITDDKVATGIVTKTGWDDIVFNAVNDMVTLLYVNDTVGWIITGQSAVTIT